MEKIKCAILHSDEDMLQRFEEFIGQTPFLTLTVKDTSPARVLAACYQKEVQLLFCGIEQDVKKVASFCGFLDDSIAVIFISSDKNRAFDCFRLNALDFLLSTDPYYVFLEAANKAFRRLLQQKPDDKLQEIQEKEEKDHIYIKSDNKVIRLDFDSIDYIESCGDYMRIFCSNKPKPIMTLCTMKKMEGVLPAGDFMRVHRSYIVRKKSISVLEYGCILFDKIRIPVGKSYQKNFQEYIKHYLSQNTL